jgi:outer membrane protein TolC
MFKYFFAALFIAVLPAWASPVTTSLPDVLKQARENNPEILAARQTWEVARNQVTSVQSWPDPTFTYVDEEFPSGMPGIANQPVKHYRLEQPIPFPGKLYNEGKMKYHEAMLAREAYRMKVLDVVRETRMRYYQLYLTDQKIALAGEGVEMMKVLLVNAQSRLASGQGSASDVFMTQTELRRMENNLYEQQQQRLLIQTELNTLLNQPTDISWGILSAPELKDLPLTQAQAIQTARQNAPDYMSALHERDHASAMLARNKLHFAPDFGVMYEHETSGSRDPGHQVGISVTFPLWLQRPWADVRAAQAHVLEAQASGLAMQNEVLKKVQTEYIETRTSITLARNFTAGILPASQSSLAVARQEYASGQGDIIRLLSAYRSWLDAHNDYQDHLYRMAEHWSLLEAWIGIAMDEAVTTSPIDHGPMEASHDH